MQVRPRVFALPLGCDFAKEFTKGLLTRFSGFPPEVMAKSEIYLNTGRVRRGVTDSLIAAGPALLPRLRLITDLAEDVRFPNVPAPTPALRRRLELFQAVAKLLEQDEQFGSRASTFDLADSLAVLMDEMQAEGVPPGRIASIDVSEHSAHWERSQAFLGIIEHFWKQTGEPDKQARQRMVVELLIRSWQSVPPAGPVIVAGSTGSRGATRMLMSAVARLPKGSVVLPCFDFDMPDEAWNGMDSSDTGEEHPQFRIKFFLSELGIEPSEVESWNPSAATNSQRNRLVSLALRPAPVTDQWMTEGHQLDGILEATEDLMIVETPNPRTEALVIALRLRLAVETGESAALVTPDPNLARQVKAALTRWNMEPDDSTGEAIADTAPGSLLHQTAGLLGKKIDSLELIALLRNHLVNTGLDRAAHVLCVDKLEFELRGRGIENDLVRQLDRLFRDENDEPASVEWQQWVLTILDDFASAAEAPLKDLVSLHRSVTERLVSGHNGGAYETNRLWEAHAGAAALKLIEDLQREGDACGTLDCHAYRHLFHSLLQRETVERFKINPFPGITIWNTLDARMQSPDVIIASGLNEGTWPSPTPIDPWLNRDLRRQAGLLMPERRTGLTAHDFQQSISVSKVVLTRSIRSADEPNVPSRWLIRLTNLLGGIGIEGETALRKMKRRGEELLALAKQIETPVQSVPRERRPYPKPPLKSRPKRLSVTAIQILAINPYQTYAQHVLGLRELEPLRPKSDAAIRGAAIHFIMLRFINRVKNDPNLCSRELLLSTAEDCLASLSAPTYAKRLWLAQLAGIADDFLIDEFTRLTNGTPVGLEKSGWIHLPDLDFRLTARADRIDCGFKDDLRLYDYKSGSIPSPIEIERGNKQIPLTAIILEKGGFDGISANKKVVGAYYLKIGKTTDIKDVSRANPGKKVDLFNQTWEEFRELIMHYQTLENGYSSRLDTRHYKYGTAYDHLARYGEWDDTDPLSNGGER